MRPRRSNFRQLLPTPGGVDRPGLARAFLVLAMAALGLSGCTGRMTTASPAAPGAPDTQTATAEGAPCIENEQGSACLPVAPESDRVDLAQPSFSDPSRVENPLHPTGRVLSALYLGKSGGSPFRSEVTLLPQLRTIEWNGQQVQALESQYVAYLDGRIQEVALDWYAQADDGSVWYLGEDVFNYEDGLLADTHGTWLAGRDGPAAMIMPAAPAVGDVYRPENAPGIVFEEVSVQSTDVTVEGPSGPVPGAIVVRELHMDGSYEDKTFAPGYGEFTTGGGNDLEAVALAVPTDARGSAMPPELQDLTSGAQRISDVAGGADWESAQTTLADIFSAWDVIRVTDVPPMLETQMDEALAVLDRALKGEIPSEVRQAAIEVARASVDLQLMYRPATEIDLARFELMLRQLELDWADADAGAVVGDTTTLEWMRDRFASSLAASDADRITGLLAEIRTAADAEDFESAADAAVLLRAFLASILPPE